MSDQGTGIGPAPASMRVVFVTGPSGAGRSTAIRALEDLGFEAIDNLPLGLVPRLLDGPPMRRPVALGLDVRNREFSAAALIDQIDQLAQRPDMVAEVLYLDCRPAELLRRYGETRRRHPLAGLEDPRQGIAREAELLASIRSRAEVLIDTSEMSPHQLKAEIARWFGPTTAARLGVSLHSFSYKRGLPRGVDIVLDCRFLRNPHWEPALRLLDGHAPEVAAYVEADPRFGLFIDKALDLLMLLLPAQVEEGKSHVAVGFGCTGGRHRSVVVVEKIAVALAAAGWQVSKRHREVEGPDAPSGDDAG